jgi:N-acetylneuraminic acid mutarotase
MQVWTALPITGLLFVVACGSAAGPADPGAPNPGWTELASLPEPLQEMHAVYYRGQVYVAGGINGSNAVTAVAYRYDTTTDGWTRIADLPAPRHHMPLAVVGDTLYAIGGFGPGGFGAVSTLWVYVPDADRWEARAPLPTPRGASAVGTVRGELVVAGGFGIGNVLLGPVALYDPATDRWRSGRSIPTRRDHLAAAVVGGRLYAIGGRPRSPDNNFAVMESYDPVVDQWRSEPPMPTARGGLGGVAADGRIHALGGETNTIVFDEHEVFDVGSGTWESVSSLPMGLHGLAVTSDGQRIFVIGGGPAAGLAQTARVWGWEPGN